MIRGTTIFRIASNNPCKIIHRVAARDARMHSRNGPRVRENRVHAYNPLHDSRLRRIWLRGNTDAERRTDMPRWASQSIILAWMLLPISNRRFSPETAHIIVHNDFRG